MLQENREYFLRCTLIILGKTFRGLLGIILVAASIAPAGGQSEIQEYDDAVIEAFYKKVIRNLISKPCIIVATSGMMIENTPSALIAQEMVQKALI